MRIPIIRFVDCNELEAYVLALAAEQLGGTVLNIFQADDKFWRVFVRLPSDRQEEHHEFRKEVEARYDTIVGGLAAGTIVLH